MFTYFTFIPVYSQNNEYTTTSITLESIAPLDNNSNVNIPLDPERIQFFLSNDTSESSSNEDKSFDVIANIITAVGAISGAIIGTLLTGRYALARERQIILAEQEKEKEFNARIKQIVKSELETFSNLLKGISEESEENMKKYQNVWKAILAYPFDYASLSLEKRAAVFDPESLSKIETSYRTFKIFSNTFNQEFPRYLNNQIDIRQLRDSLDANNIRLNIDESVKLLK